MPLVSCGRWAEIYVSSERLWSLLPDWFFNLASWAARMRTQRRLHRKFANVERDIAKLAPRPLLMIHGAKDNYIGPDIARALFALAREPKELWIVPKAKHNRCREVDPQGYRDRVASFFRRYAPATAIRPARTACDDTDAALGAVDDRVRLRPISDGRFQVSEGKPRILRFEWFEHAHLAENTRRVLSNPQFAF